MSVAVWIPPAQQFGGLAPGEARQGAMRQAIAQAVKRHLFADGESESGPSPGYDCALVAFARALAQGFNAPGSRPEAQSLWAEVFPPGDLATAAAAAEAHQVPTAVESGFCFGVQGLCSSLALRWTDTREGADHDAEGADGPDDDDREEPAASTEWRVEYSRVVGAVAALLRQGAWRWLRDDPADETRKEEDLWLVATVLLNALLLALSDWFAVSTGETGRRGGRPHTPKYIVLRNPALEERLAVLSAALPFLFTVQPLKSPVSYRLEDRGPADTDEADYFRVDLIGYRRTNDFLRRIHAGALHPSNRAPEFLRYVEAVNIQQAVPWRVSRRVLYWARALIAIGVGDAESSEAMPQALEGVDPGTVAELRGWVRKHFYRPVGNGSRRTIELPGEFLDSPLAKGVLDDLCRDGPDGKPVAFYLPWKADYRGRIYAETPWLTPQGGDLQRALLEFHRGRPLEERGAQALRRHGANLVRRARLLEDLSIEGRQVLTLDERERWVAAHEGEILASAESPLTEPFWRQRSVTGKPMQFLAFCLSYRQWKQDPSAPVHVPVQIDGTCNGLQHIAALTGDSGLARAVNVLPSDDGLPGDVYSELAAVAGGTLGRLSFGKRQDPHRQGLELADVWLAAAPQRRAWLSRESAKKVVMTIPYGASAGAQARHVLEMIIDEFEQQWEQAAPALPELDALVAWKEQSDARRIFVARCTQGLFASLRRSAFSGTDELAVRLAHSEWQHKRTFAAYVALALVRHLHEALTSKYPSVNDFSAWLKQTASACAGMPLVWQSELGLPVCQDKFRLKGTSVQGRLGTKAVRIDVERLDETVDPNGQRQALLPNLIHSLDAAHLAMTLLDAQKRGIADIGSIHDCLLCHPNDAARLGEAVRRTFARLYAPGRLDLPGPLMRWHDWMALLVELNGAPRRAELLAALTYPGEQGERDLDHDAHHGDRDARRALDLLQKIRGRDAPQRFLLRMLLQSARDQAGRLPLPGKPPLMPSPPCPAGLPLGSGALSDYFFS